MKKVQPLQGTTFLVLVAIAATTSSAFAKPAVSLHLSGAVVARTNGSEHLTPLEHVARVKSGDIVSYRIVASNSGSEPAKHFSSVARIPAGTTYLAGSASHAAQQHVELGRDGKTIRWVNDRPLPAHTTLQYSYRVRVK